MLRCRLQILCSVSPSDGERSVAEVVAAGRDDCFVRDELGLYGIAAVSGDGKRISSLKLGEVRAVELELIVYDADEISCADSASLSSNCEFSVEEPREFSQLLSAELGHAFSVRVCTACMAASQPMLSYVEVSSIVVVDKSKGERFKGSRNNHSSEYDRKS